jgi:hypothetical protein
MSKDKLDALNKASEETSNHEWIDNAIEELCRYDKTNL